jgi:type VI secretion system protein ImpL
MFAFLKSRVLLVTLGFILLALFIWYAGPLFAFGDLRPLESETARIVAILLVVLIWIGAQVLKRMRANRASDKLVAAVVQQSRVEERPGADAVQLRERFEEAVAFLKQKRRSGHSLYELPWYVIIGAPGSGKTTALVNSGLHFPLEQRSGKGALRGVGGTRNCDWWFTDEAIFLDTAGPYTTQDSDANADSAGWSEFLKLLQKYRKRRPVNGVILTISAQDLMAQGHMTRESHITATRRRLTELNKELNIKLPVYLMVTKCDLVAGFTEYFDDVVQEGRTQVWGVTFPYEVTTAGGAAAAFPNEFDALMSRLNERVFTRLDEERDPRRRTKIFGFPQQMAALRDLLGGFVTDVFASTRFDQQILLRGVYFTSGTQEGTPIDRLLGAIGRRFAVAPEAVVNPGGRGKAYFIERLLKDVLFAESGLAGLNRRLEIRMAAAQLGAYAAMALVAILAVVGLTISYNRNRAYVDDVAADVAAFSKTPRVEAGRSLETIVPRLEAVKHVADSANRYSESGAPWSMRLGLYQGNSLGNAARDAYSRELEGALLPEVTSRIEQRMVAYVSEPLKMYQYLKAYLMLGDPSRMVKSQLAFIADREWKAAYPADPDLGAAVARHFQTLLENEDELRPMPLDQALIERARGTITQVSIPQLVYQTLQLNYSEPSALRLDTAAGLGATEVFTRKSGASLSQPVPRIYTADVFKEITGANSALIVKQFTDEYWVWGEQRLSLASTTRLRDDVIGIYEKDYIEYWDGVLNDVRLAAFPNSPVMTNRLAILASTSSPLRGLLKVVRDNTTLVEPPKQTESTTTGLRSTIDAIFNEGKEQIGLSTLQPGAQVTAHFTPIRRMTEGDPGSAPIDRILAQIGEIQKQLSLVGSSLGGVPPLEAISKAGQGQLVNSLRQEAQTMPPAVGAIVTQITGQAARVTTGEASNEIENRYRQDVLAKCEQFVTGRYPFAASSMSDVTLQDFAQLFGPNGVFDQFFRTNLQGVVDTTRSPWVWRSDQSGVAIRASDSILRRVEAAQRIRERYFGVGSQMVQVNFNVTPLNMDAAVRRFILEVDGQSFVYQHGPERTQPATWPGPKPGTAAATFEDAASGRPNIAFSGPWAWFRLLDAAQIKKESELRYDVTLEKGGYKALVRIEASSVVNPFGPRELQQFRCEL